jgi:VWFA-related protein
MVLGRRLPPLVLALSAFLLSRSVAADKKEPPTTVREEAKVVVIEVPVNVIDKDGHPVEGLTAQDFEVYDDGKKQTISGLDVVDERHAVPQPGPGEPEIHPAARRHFLMIFDLTFSTPKAIVKARANARDFVVTRMKDLDLAAVATWSVEQGLRLLVTFTGDRTQLAAAIDTLGFPMMSQRVPDPLSMLISPPSMSNSTGFSYLPSATSTNAHLSQADLILEDALENTQALREKQLRTIYRDQVNRLLDSFQQLAKALDAVKGRKHILYMSEGFDSAELVGSSLKGGGSYEGEAVITGQSWKVDSDSRFGNHELRDNMEKALSFFNKSDCVIHSIDIAGLRAASDPSGSIDNSLSGQDSLFSFAEETGGEFLKNTNDLSGSFDKLLERTGLIYVLAFQLSRVPETGKFHTLKVKVKNSSYRVSARSGYYEPKPYSSLTAVEKKLVASSALAEAIPKTDIPAWVLSSPFPTGDGTSRVPVIVEVPGDRLMSKVDSPQMSVDLFVYAVDKAHETKDYLFQSITFDLAKVGDRLRRAGIKYYGEMTLPPGDYKLRVLVRNNQTGQLGVSISPLTVPESADTFASPPLFLDQRPEWVMVRGKGHAPEQRAGSYPFSIGGEAFVPAALPNVKSGDLREICVYAHNFGSEVSDIKYTGRILGEDGRPHGRAELHLVRAGADEPGGQALLLQFTPHGLDPGRYALAVKLQNATGKSSESVLSFDVH